MKYLVILLLFLSLSAAVQAREITGLERWQDEVRVTEPLRVAKSGSLIIAPGTKVVSETAIEVAGRLQASEVDFSGNDWPGLVFKGTDAGTWLKNCRVTGARTGVTVIGGGPILSGVVFEQNRVGLEFRQKSNALVENSLFRNNSKVGLFIKDEATVSVLNNRFEKQGKFGAYIYRALPQKFTGNQFLGNPTGLMISHFGSNPRIEDNLFRDNLVGIKIDRTAKPQLVANQLTGNQVGIALYRRADPLIEKNLFTQNHQAIHISFSSYPLIRFNDFVANPRALVLEFQSAGWEEQKGAEARQDQLSVQGAFGGQKQNQVTEEERRARNLDGTVDARQNWWGAQETAELETLTGEANLRWIDDGRDRPSFEEGGKIYPLDQVRWAPFSRQPFTSGGSR